MKSMKNKKTKGVFGSVIKIAVGSFLLIASGLLIAASIVFRFDEWRELDPELITKCPRSLLIFDNNNELISVMGPETRIPISIDTLNKHTIDAFVSAEDARFYSHDGIDVYRIFGAAWADIKAGGYVQGASTISQQLIKLSHLSTEKTLDRKLEEAVLAMQLERRFDKEDIMEMYLNYIYFGGGFYGIEAASLGYFGVHAGELTIAQSAQLAGILKSPTAYAPHLDMEASLSRRDVILGLMNKYGYISEDELTRARSEECVLNNGIPKVRSALTDRSIDEASVLLGIDRDELLEGGYSIRTTYDGVISRCCEELMNDGKLFPASNAQGAIVVLDRNGGIAAIKGERGPYSAAGVDRAANTERQPGSLIKPVLVYAPAIELYGYEPTTILEDEPKAFGNYSPRNSDDRYYGKVTLRTAVSKSLNIPAVSVLSDIGLPSAVMFAQRLGISFDNEQPGLSMALGGFTHGVSPLEMAGAYSAFQRGGVFIEPYCVKSIVDASGEALYSRALSGERVMSEQNAFLLTSMLQSAATEGTAKRLAQTGLPLAAKTGTSIDENGVRDAWCAAYSADYTAVCWMGTDSASKGSLPEEAVGGNHTAVLLGDLFSEIYRGKVCPDFIPPEGISSALIDTSSEEEGVIYAANENTPPENTQTEYYIEGDEPEKTNPVTAAPQPPQNVGWSIGEDGFPIISFEAENKYMTYRLIRRDGSGEEITVGEASGISGFASIKDESATQGAMYIYYIAVTNEGIKNDSEHKSSLSRQMQVIVPFKVQ